MPEAEMPEEIRAPARASGQRHRAGELQGWHRAARVAGDTQQTAACCTSRFSPPDGREITNYTLIINQFPVILS